MIHMQIFSQTMMENLINDLLDLAKMQNNQFSQRKEYFNLTDLIYESFSILRESAFQRQIKLTAEIKQKK
jgi:signal transduction histidine kinase